MVKLREEEGILVVGEGDLSLKVQRCIDHSKEIKKAGFRQPEQIIGLTDELFHRWVKACEPRNLEGMDVPELDMILEHVGTGYIAVRSAGTSEGTHRSPGIYSTKFVLFNGNKYDKGMLRKRISDVFKSYFYPDAKAYRKKKGIQDGGMGLRIEKVVGINRVYEISSTDPNKQKRGFAPYCSGYINTQYEDKILFCIVKGMGSAAVSSFANMAFLYWYDRKTRKIEHVKDTEQDTSYYLTERTNRDEISQSTISTLFFNPEQIIKNLAKKTIKLEKLLNLDASEGFDIEFAIDSMDVSEYFKKPHMTQIEIMPKIHPIEMPKGESVIGTYSMIGNSVKRFEKGILIRYLGWHEDEFSSIVREYNEKNKGDYVMFVERDMLMRKQHPIPYNAFYNAGAFIESINEGTGWTWGKNHFALLCNDSDILFVEGYIKEGLFNQIYREDAGRYEVEVKKTKSEAVSELYFPKGITVAVNEVDNEAKILLEKTPKPL